MARGGRGASGGQGCPAKGLDGAGHGEAPSYEASCPGSYTPPKMDSQWGMHSDLRPERCSFTHPLSSQWRKHSSPRGPRIKAPRGPVKSLACVKSPAPIGSGMGGKAFRSKVFHAHAPPYR